MQARVLQHEGAAQYLSQFFGQVVGFFGALPFVEPVGEQAESGAPRQKFFVAASTSMPEVLTALEIIALKFETFSPPCGLYVLDTTLAEAGFHDVSEEMEAVLAKSAEGLFSMVGSINPLSFLDSSSGAPPALVSLLVSSFNFLLDSYCARGSLTLQAGADVASRSFKDIDAFALEASRILGLTSDGVVSGVVPYAHDHQVPEELRRLFITFTNERKNLAIQVGKLAALQDGKVREIEYQRVLNRFFGGIPRMLEFYRLNAEFLSSLRK